MSRCYPFPPPGYAGKCSSHEALILSIKLQKEKEKANSNREVEKCIPEREREKSKSSSGKKRDREERREKKKDKDDRKKEKKDKDVRKKEKKEKKRENRFDASGPPAESIVKQDFVDKLSKAGNVPLDLQRTNVERLERSSVTEEHGQPIDSQNAPCSSDSTGNSGKRKRSMPSPSGIQSNGNIIRIRLSTSQKRDEPSTSGSKGQEASHLPQARKEPVVSHNQASVSLVRPETSIKQKDVISTSHGHPCPASTSTATLQLVSVEVSDLKAKTTVPVSQKENLSSHDKIQPSGTFEKFSSHYRRMQKKESAYKKLLVDWVPPPLERIMVEEDDEEDWLFGKKGEIRSAKRLRVSDDVVDNLSCSASAVMQPLAHFLADAEIYALPFTVPF